jgi:hydrogenase nickel incorporation protein HypA/HybF
MHELSIASALLEKVLDEAKKRGGGRVTDITLRIGAMSHILPESLEFAFEALAKAGPAESARFRIERPALMLRCRACGWEGESSHATFLCTRCRSGDVEIRAGNELTLESFTLEQDG